MQYADYFYNVTEIPTVLYCLYVNVLAVIGNLVGNTVEHFSLLRIVEAVESTYEIACDTSYTLEGPVVVVVFQVNIFAVHVYFKVGKLLIGLLSSASVHISLDFCVAEGAAVYCDINIFHSKTLLE